MTVTLAALLATAGCADAPVRDQWTVRITTDAPVPQLVDRALVEVIDDTGTLACSDCSRPVPVPTDPTAWPISFGIAKADADETLHVRIRLYRAARTGEDGLPLPATALDTSAKLPPAHGNSVVGLVVPADCVGVPSDVASHTTCLDSSRALSPEPTLTAGDPDATIRPGTWAPAISTPCTGAPDGMVCVSGGFFVLGDATDFSVTNGSDNSDLDERFVTLSPFALDREEMTVGTVRGLVKAGKLPSEPTLPGGPTSIHAQCTYLGSDDATNDTRPVNCVTNALAVAACAALGKRLPTEAEWEWAAGNQTDESRYPWENDGLDTCDEADVGLGFSVLATDVAESSACRFFPAEPVRLAGLPATPNPADKTALGIASLAGGLEEWVADFAASYVAPCWHPQTALLVDPSCDIDTSNGMHILRGAGWSDSPGLVSSVRRQALGDADPVADADSHGFRCAVSRGASP